MTIGSKARFFLSIGLVMIFHTLLYAALPPIDINGTAKVSLLAQSEVLISPEALSLEEVRTAGAFQRYRKNYLNLGISRDFIYIRFKLENRSDRIVDKALIAHSPLLENITLYEGEALSDGLTKGIMHIDESHHTIPYYFRVSLMPYSTKVYYLKIHSSIRTVGFSLTLEDENSFLEHDRLVLTMNLLLIGIVMALMFYSFFLSYYMRDRSYFFYGLYLIVLLYQQASYLGIIQLYFAKSFVIWDTYMIIVKIILLVITAALFAMYFLEIKRYPKLHKVYLSIILLVIVELLLLDPHHRYALLVAVFTASFFIFFNLFAGIYVYRRGLKQARLFIVGVGMVSLSYVIMLLDVLGIASLMQYVNTLLLWGTTLEAFILSLAFVDRYMILQKEKQEMEQIVLHETQNRALIIEEEVKRKTEELKRALETKEILMREINHRVKNNLQIILSMIRLQKLDMDDQKTKERFYDLESRINAIAKTYVMLLENDNIDHIDMQQYIDMLLADISDLYNEKNDSVEIMTDISGSMSIKKSIYLGLIINELVTNSYKHAFKEAKGTIVITLKESGNHYTLTYEDDGKGFDWTRQERGLGLKLVHNLVKDQLEGSIEMPTKRNRKYIIKFSL